MSHTPHELIEEFPDQIDTMHTLKEANAHFAKIYDEYHFINRAIHRAETDVEPTDDLHISEMRRQRMALKDQVSAALRTA